MARLIEFPRFARLLPAVLLILQGCASVSAPPEAMGAAPTDLLFGIRAIGGVNGAGWTAEAVESRRGAVVVGLACLLPDLSVSGAQIAVP